MRSARQGGRERHLRPGHQCLRPATGRLGSADLPQLVSGSERDGSIHVQNRSMPGLRRPGRLYTGVPTHPPPVRARRSPQCGLRLVGRRPGRRPRLGGLLPGQRLRQLDCRLWKYPDQHRSDEHFRPLLRPLVLDVLDIWQADDGGPDGHVDLQPGPLSAAGGRRPAHPVPTDQSFRVLGCSGHRKFQARPGGAAGLRSSLEECLLRAQTAHHFNHRHRLAESRRCRAERAAHGVDGGAGPRGHDYLLRQRGSGRRLHVHRHHLLDLLLDRRLTRRGQHGAGGVQR